jgi:hypothetical protein
MSAMKSKKSIKSLPGLIVGNDTNFSQSPVVKKSFKETLNDIFGFIRVGGDFG